MRRILVFVAAMLWLVPGANADNGVLEINAACVSVGCFSGDDPDWPVEIDGSVGRSYRLTSDLTVPDKNTIGVKVNANDISIDLNGFAIIGPVTCEGNPLVCSHSVGTGDGVESFREGTSVKNGSITGMGGVGAALAGFQAEATNLRVRWNRGTGVYVNRGSVVGGVTAYENGSQGIHAEVASVVSNNAAYRNGSDGIYAASGSTISNNTTEGNGGHGIYTWGGSVVSGNTAYGNAGYGFRFLNSGVGYSGNVIFNNTLGTITGSPGVQLGLNACDGNTMCP